MTARAARAARHDKAVQTAKQFKKPQPNRRVNPTHLSRRNALASPVKGLTSVVQSRSIMMEHLDCCIISRGEKGRTRDARSRRRVADMLWMDWSDEFKGREVVCYV